MDRLRDFIVKKWTLTYYECYEPVSHSNKLSVECFTAKNGWKVINGKPYCPICIEREIPSKMPSYSKKGGDCKNEPTFLHLA